MSLNWGYIMKVDPIGLAMTWTWGVRGKKELKTNPKFLTWAIRMELPIYWAVKDYKRNIFGGSWQMFLLLLLLLFFKCQVFLRCSNGNIKQAVEYVSLELRLRLEYRFESPQCLHGLWSYGIEKNCLRSKWRWWRWRRDDWGLTSELLQSNRKRRRAGRQRKPRVNSHWGRRKLRKRKSLWNPREDSLTRWP